MQEPKDKKAIMADAYSDKRVNELKKATNTPYQMEMASKKKPVVKSLKVMKSTKKPAGKPETKEMMFKAKYSM